MKKTENTRKSFRSRTARLTAMILTVLMAVMMLPTHAFAASDESGSLSAYTLYNYISLNNGSTYISLNTQPNGIRTAKSAQDFHRENGNKRYDLSADEYEIDDYDLSSLVILQNGLRFVEQSVAAEGQPYFTARLDRVEAVALARFRDSISIEPRTEAFTSLENNEITFHRNWYITLVSPMVSQKVLTGIRLGDGKNGNGNGLYYGIDYTETALCFDSRYIPFETKLSAAQYSMPDYDFTDLVLSFNGESYAYRPNGPVAGDGEQFHYYTVSFLKMDKLAKSTYGGGYLKEGWPSWPLIRNTKEAGTDGAPNKAGYYHRDYQVTLHIEDAPAAEIVEETNEETEETVEESSEEVEETVEETNEEVEETVEEINEEAEETVEEISEEAEETVEENNEAVEETVEEDNKEVEETVEENNEVEETVEEINEVEETVEETNEEEEIVEETNEVVEETVEEISEEVEETVEETSEEVEESVEETNEEVEETVEEISEEVEETVKETNEAVEETVEEISEEVKEAVEETNEVEETVEETSEEVEETVEENSEEVEETAEEISEEVEETVEEISEEVEETAEENNEAVAETAEENNEAVEETVEENSEAVEETVEETAPAAENSEVNASIERAKAQNTDTQIASAALPVIEEIEDEAAPLAKAPEAGWSLMNLIAVILTALIVLGMALRRTAGIFGIIPAIASAAIFALNDTISGAMVLMNSWTPVMIAILLAAAVMAAVIAKKDSKQNV